MSMYMAEPPNEAPRQPNPPTLHGELTASAVTLTVIATISVAMRIFTRASVTQAGISMDDYMVIIALVLAITLLGLNFEHMKVGLGYHFWDVKTVDFVLPFQVYTLCSTIVYATSLIFTKISILLFYLRLSPQLWFRVAVWILIGITSCYGLMYNLLSIFACKPIAATWNLALMPQAECVGVLPKYMALSILNIVIDVLTLILPIPVVWKLQMSLRQKLSIILVFMTGGLVCIIAIRRTILLKPLMASADYTWDAVEQFHWCFAEVDVAIVCASAPALKPFFVKYVPGLLSSRWGSSHDPKSYGGKSNPSGIHVLQTISQQRTRKSNKNAYELHSRDDLSEEEIKHGHVDDEARLWNARDMKHGGLHGPVTDSRQTVDIVGGRR
ncbi:unnamed protein product [Periconia digitata]|uniref:Rhodopsin domain-containing protein n=1 Tax=Periconia digitata TaxID=1303443 RepID=A0A9W4XEW9_9PLEO|nr:unnamed protein product [Periconia digitata]